MRKRRRYYTKVSEYAKKLDLKKKHAGLKSRDQVIVRFMRMDITGEKYKAVAVELSYQGAWIVRTIATLVMVVPNGLKTLQSLFEKKQDL